MGYLSYSPYRVPSAPGGREGGHRRRRRDGDDADGVVGQVVSPACVDVSGAAIIGGTCFSLSLADGILSTELAALAPRGSLVVHHMETARFIARLPREAGLADGGPDHRRSGVPELGCAAGRRPERPGLAQRSAFRRHGGGAGGTSRAMALVECLLPRRRGRSMGAS